MTVDQTGQSVGGGREYTRRARCLVLSDSELYASPPADGRVFLWLCRSGTGRHGAVTFPSSAFFNLLFPNFFFFGC